MRTRSLTATVATLFAITLTAGLAAPPSAAGLVYWTTGGSPTAGWNFSIGVARADGSGASDNFINLAQGPMPTLATGTEHLYWTDDTSPGTIGRANLDGTGVDPDLIGLNITGPGYTAPTEVAVGAGYVYWVDLNRGTIGRANLDGTGVDLALISAPGAGDIAVGGGHIYWTEIGIDAATIARASLDGTGIERDFIVTDPDSVLQLGHRRPCRRRQPHLLAGPDERLGTTGDRPRQPRRQRREPRVHQSGVRREHQEPRRRRWSDLLGRTGMANGSAAPTSTAPGSSRA